MPLVPPEVDPIWADIVTGYSKAGYPQIGLWSYRSDPQTPQKESACNWLAHAGLIRACGVDPLLWKLTEGGMQTALAHRKLADLPAIKARIEGT
jgi:hypothetical protein